MKTKSHKHGLLDLLKGFEEAQHSHAKYGAWDTEPDGIFQEILREAAFGRPYPNVRTPRDWDLFEMKKGASLAAFWLTKKAEHIHARILEWRKELPVDAWNTMDGFLQEFCWRLGSWE